MTYHHNIHTLHDSHRLSKNRKVDTLKKLLILTLISVSMYFITIDYELPSSLPPPNPNRSQTDLNLCNLTHFSNISKTKLVVTSLFLNGSRVLVPMTYYPDIYKPVTTTSNSKNFTCPNTPTNHTVPTTPTNHTVPTTPTTPTTPTDPAISNELDKRDQFDKLKGALGTGVLIVFALDPVTSIPLIPIAVFVTIAYRTMIGYI